MWTRGIIGINGHRFKYEAKVYDNPSEYGLFNGRVSKLCITENGKILFNYDRGLDIDSDDEDVNIAIQIILDKYK